VLFAGTEVADVGDDVVEEGFRRKSTVAAEGFD
jgi:hypothetical protein